MDKELRILRNKAGYTRKYVALKLGIHPRYFNRIENGEGAMSKSRAEILGELYNINKHDIMKIWRAENERNIKKRIRADEITSKT